MHVYASKSSVMRVERIVEITTPLERRISRIQHLRWRAATSKRATAQNEFMFLFNVSFI